MFFGKISILKLSFLFTVQNQLELARRNLFDSFRYKTNKTESSRQRLKTIDNAVEN